jgi:prolyl-tRNA synthetase
MDLNAIPVRADTGPIGGDLSHEFHVLADTGESAIYYDATFDDLCQQPEPDVENIMAVYAMADEMHQADQCPVPQERLKQRRGIEVGHIFNYGTKYSVSMKASVMDATGSQIPTQGGCYGIGVSRLIAAIIEVHHDEHGIIWPESVAPFHIGLINLKPADAACTKVADELYAALEKQGIEVLYDDRDQSAGAKFSTMDLIGLPYQIIIGPKGVAEGVLEVKNRKTQARENLSLAEILNRFKTS